MKIIACDFDGTLCENRFPEIGEPRWQLIEKLKDEQKLGAKAILWTCREGALLTAAVDWCRRFGLLFDALNGNLPETIERMQCDPRKVYATEYWDDKGKSV